MRHCRYLANSLSKWRGEGRARLVPILPMVKTHTRSTSFFRVGIKHTPGSL